MRVKKQIALLLSGAILTGSLAGCDRTIIEHQFHTDTEYIETIIENSDMNGTEKLTGWFLAHGITPVIQLEADIGDFFYNPNNTQEAVDLLVSQYDLSTKPITEETISLLYQRTFNKEVTEDEELEARLTRFIKCDSASDLTSAWLIYANSVYDALIKYADEWDWDSIGDRIEQVKMQVEMAGKIINCSVDRDSPPQYYAQFAIGLSN